MLFIPMSPIPEKTSKQLGEVMRDSDVSTAVLVLHRLNVIYVRPMTSIQFIMKELVLCFTQGHIKKLLKPVYASK